MGILRKNLRPQRRETVSYTHLGIYYLTQERPGVKGEGMAFKSVNEAILAYENKEVTLHSKVKVRMTRQMPDGTEKTGIVESTVGRFIFNEIIPQDLGFVDRSIERCV